MFPETELWLRVTRCDRCRCDGIVTSLFERIELRGIGTDTESDKFWFPAAISASENWLHRNHAAKQKRLPAIIEDFFPRCGRRFPETRLIIGE